MKMDITHHFIQSGNGFPLILLHGNGEDSTYFRHQIDFFSARYCVIALDTRGHGKSPRGSAPFTIRQFALDLYEFMKAHAIERAHLLGFSDGGNIALTFALQHPEVIDHLILNGANLTPSGVKTTVQLPIVLGYHMASLFAKKSVNAAKNAEMLGLMVNEPNFHPEELHSLTMPTLVIAGKRDMIKEKHTRLIAENLPNGKLAILAGDHFIANKNPTEFNRCTEQFLEDK